MSQLYTWDCVLKAGVGGTASERKSIVADLKELAKKWAFQLEQGEESGYLHWQMRFSLFKKLREKELISELMGRGWIGFKVLPTSNNGSKSFDYVLKSATRVEGPWCDKDPAPPYIQERFRDPSPYQWQLRLKQFLFGLADEKNDRNIVMVEDEGGSGKSWFKGWMSSEECVVIIPASMDSAEKMIQFICSNPTIKEGWKGIVLLDIPRATSPKHWFTLAAGLETIKQGHLYDGRYRHQVKVIEPPQICCFMNNKPPAGCMTSDVFIYFDKDQ